MFAGSDGPEIGSNLSSLRRDIATNFFLELDLSRVVPAVTPLVSSSPDIVQNIYKTRVRAGNHWAGRYFGPCRMGVTSLGTSCPDFISVGGSAA